MHARVSTVEIAPGVYLPELTLQSDEENKTEGAPEKKAPELATAMAQKGRDAYKKGQKVYSSLKQAIIPQTNSSDSKEKKAPSTAKNNNYVPL